MSKRQKTEEGGDVKSGVPRYRTSDDFLRLLVRMKSLELQPKSGVVFVCQRDSNVMDVWKGLIKHNFLSVPVLQKTDMLYYGFVDMADIVKHVVDYFGEKRLNQEDLNFWELAGKEHPLNQLKINDIMKYPLSRRNPFKPVNEDYSLFSSLEFLARERGLHRVPVIDHDRKLVNLITQSQVCDFLNDKMELIGEKRKKPVGIMRHVHEPVITVKEEEKALDAFETITEKHVTGLAVVNEEGELSGVISVRDLKAIRSDGRMFWRLYQTVKNFLAKVKVEFQKEHGRPKSVVSVTNQDTLETVVKRMSENRVHRLFIVSAENKPIGVVSMKDVIAEILNVDDSIHE